MERQEEGYFISDEEVDKAAKAAVLTGAGIIVIKIVRWIFSPPVIWIKNEQ